MHEWSASTQYHGTPAGYHPSLGVAGENEEGGKMIGYFRKRKRVAWIVTLLMSVTILFGMSGTTVSAATGAVADDVTIGHWHDSIAIDDTTKNIGRIWTDKSVSAGNIVMGKLDNSGTKTVEKNGNSDFLVGLSALSSAAKIMGQSTVPLDIVMVLDVSGSMDADNKMKTLKKAVNSFIDETARTNSERSNENLRSRISLVKFSDSAQVVSEYKACTNDNKAELKDKVNALRPAGATAADYAMDQAKKQVKQSKIDEAANPDRKNVKRIVIFFTDGEPNHGNGFNERVANTAIQTAKGIKADAKMYSIGVFKDADASITTGGSGFWGGWTDKELFNTYMHGMSSNYPNATAYDNLGTRATNSDGKPTAFYKAATQASELNNIFNEIQEEIIATAQSPTEVEAGADPTQSGYVTLVDQLGDYMQVDDLNSLLYAENQYHYTKKDVTKEGNTTKVTYTFEKEIPDTNHVYPTGNLRDIKITVEKADAATALATGDKVTVKIPANLIPLRYYEVTKDNKITIDNTYPFRLFYDVSLKAAAEKKLERPDEAMEAYIAENSNEDGQVAFYANKYDKKSSNRGSEGIGAYANFTPASTNDFYYFQKDEILYTDEACTHPEKDSIDTSGDTTYYYQRQYYEKGASGNAVKKTYTVKIPGNSNLLLEGYAKKNTKTGEYYIPAGTPRSTSLTYFTENKADGANKSQTSNRVIKPVWENNYAGKSVFTYLGNNGKLVKELPGELDIRKSVQAAEDHQVPDSLKDQEFEYSLTFTGGTKEKYTAQKYTGADKEGDEFTVKSGDTFKLKDDQTLKIYGVDGGTRYTVTEAKPEHFTGSAAQRNAGEGSETGTNNDGGVYAKGTVAGKDAAVVDYTNIYQADSTTLKGSESLKIKKNFETASGASAWDMDYLKDAKFQFILSPLDNECPMPKDAAVVDGMKVSRLNVNSKAEIEKAFGDIEYTKPGTYEYQITEKDPGDTAKQGVTYSSASYRVTVKVTDENGRLKANATMKKIRKDDGSEVANPTAVDNKTAAFANVYDAKEQTVDLGAGKEFTDSTGTKTLKDGDYKFRLTPVTEGAPLPDGASGHVDASNIGNGVKFGNITFTAEHAKGATQDKPLTYEYKMKEILPESATASNHYTVDGLTYDNAEYKVRINVYIDDVDGQDTVVADYKYLDADGKELQTMPIFRNSYKADAVTLTGNTALAGEKTLTGRDGKTDEAFNFKLTPDAETQKAIEKNDVSIAENGDTASVKNLKNGEAKDFGFGNVTFRKEGVYRFDITEKVPGTPAGGVTYDRHAAKVTVTVTDDADHPGKLKAKVEYNNGTASDRTDKAVFKNKYESSLVYGATGALNIQKVLNGRTMKAGEFEFTYGPKDGQTAKITNPNQCESGKPDTMNVLADLSFDQTMSGKTQTYIVRETKGSINGVTYDERIGTVEITPQDNGDGTMHVVTKVTMKNADGSGESVKKYDSSNHNSGTPTVRFTNTYSTKPMDSAVTGQVQIKKALAGRSMEEGEFHFVLKNEEGKTLDNAVNDKDGNITFKKLTFKNVGTYNYTVEEVAGNDRHITYDTNSYNVSAAVTDNLDGTLKVTWTSGTGAILFKNTYTVDPTDATPSVEKKIAGGNPAKDSTFRFILTGKDNAPMPEGSKDGKKSTSVTGEGKADFGKITFDKAGTYTYKVAEENGNESSYNYDSNEYTLIYKVKDVKGELKAEQSITAGDKSADEMVFTNEYAPASMDGDTAITGTKELAGRSMQKDEKFEFTLKAGDEATQKAIDEKDIVLDDTNASLSGMRDGQKSTFSFGRAEFSKEGEYTFTVTEKDGGKAGMTYDTKEKTFKVKVAKVNGIMTAVQEETPTFKNVYEASGEFTPAGTKTLLSENGNKLSVKDNQFKFSVYYTGHTDGEAVTTGTTGNGKDAEIGFGKLSYTISDLEKLVAKGYADKEELDNGARYYIDYVVIENASENNALQANTQEPTFRVEVTDNGDGTLRAESEEGSKLAFENLYKSNKATVHLNGQKVLEGRPLKADEFTFNVTSDEENAPMPEKTEVKNKEGGNIDFGTITYGKDDLGDATEKTFTYQVKESGEQPGVANDTETKTVKVTVKDDGKCHITAETEPKEAPLFAFNNTYSTTSKESSVTDTVKIRKTLTGRKLKNKEFTFVLKDKDGKNVAEAKNNADGSIAFKSLTFDEVGTYNYTVKEVKGNAKRVSYDANAYQVTATVTDNLDGTLSVKWSTGTKKEIHFYNRYKKKTVTPNPSGKHGGKADNNNIGPFTGDDSNADLYLGLMGASAAILAALAGSRKKRKL